MRKTPITLAATAAAAVALAACGTSHPAASTSSALSSAAAAPAATAAPSPAGPTPAQCAQQMTAWLTAPAQNAPVPDDTNQQVISAIVFDADAYLHYGPGGPNAGNDATIASEAGQNFLNDVGTEDGFLGTADGIPACADPGQDISGTGGGSLIGDASNASTDTPGTSQATADTQAVTTDLAAANQELVTTAPGVIITGLQTGTTW